jgi:hypothetical protein
MENPLFNCVACTQNFDSDENLSAHDQQFHPEVQMGTAQQTGAGKVPGPNPTPDDVQKPDPLSPETPDTNPDEPQTSHSGIGSNA